MKRCWCWWLACVAGCATAPPPPARPVYVAPTPEQKAEQARLRGYEAERRATANALHLEDWTRWYGRFIADGYTHDEASLKADRLMGASH